MALKTLTFLYIGGASSTAQLFSCRSEDGGAGRNRNRIVDVQDDCITEVGLYCSIFSPLALPTRSFFLDIHSPSCAVLLTVDISL